MSHVTETSAFIVLSTELSSFCTGEELTGSAGLGGYVQRKGCDFFSTLLWSGQRQACRKGGVPLGPRQNLARTVLGGLRRGPGVFPEGL